MSAALTNPAVLCTALLCLTALIVLGAWAWMQETRRVREANVARAVDARLVALRADLTKLELSTADEFGLTGDRLDAAFKLTAERITGEVARLDAADQGLFKRNEAQVNNLITEVRQLCSDLESNTNAAVGGLLEGGGQRRRGFGAASRANIRPLPVKEPQHG